MVRNMMPWNTAGGHLLDAVRREMDDLVGRLDGTLTEDGEVDFASFVPRTNVIETEAQFELALELPGMKAEDFDIELHEGKLTVNGERTKEEVVEGTTVHRLERSYGKFSRAFRLGSDVNSDGIAAEYRDGILFVTVPKSEKAKPVRIEVK